MEGRIRVLVVDDHAPFRGFLRSKLETEPSLLVIGEAQDGLTAIKMAQEVQPDLITLDIGLPELNGIEAGRRIRDLAPLSRILFLSENRSFDIVREALRSGGDGYVVKSDCSEELLPAILSVLQGHEYISSSLVGTDCQPNRNKFRPMIQSTQMACCHEVGFYSDDRKFLEDVTLFLGTAILKGDSAIVIATESHREVIVPRLKSFGVDIDGAIEQGRYLTLDAEDALSKFMIDGMPDPARLMTLFDDLIPLAKNAANREHPRVAVFGECVQILCAQGNAEAAIQMEKLGSRVSSKHHVDILCGYFVNRLHGLIDGSVHKRICAEHSAVRFDSQM